MNEKNKNKSKKGKIDKPKKKFPVVGIGASAGGFDALKKFSRLCHLNQIWLLYWYNI
ncbi:MAG: hypothetical protein Q8M06_04695 [Methanobacteriaceae archaeon]|nr:hypothetical protein [Methanobacteriaceae archaeon]